MRAGSDAGDGHACILCAKGQHAENVTALVKPDGGASADQERIGVRDREGVQSTLMKSQTIVGFALVAGLVTFGLSVAAGAEPTTQPVFGSYVLDFTTPVDPALQSKFEAIDLG